jgi:hypothetical protein
MCFISAHVFCMFDPSDPLMALGKERRSGKSSWCSFSLFSLPCQMPGLFTNIPSLFLGGRGDSIGSIMTRLWAGRSCPNFSRCKRFLSVSKRPFWLWGPHSLIWSLPRFFPGVKCPGCQVDHLPPSSGKVKNEWNCTSALACVPSCCGQGQLCHFLPFMF